MVLRGHVLAKGRAKGLWDSIDLSHECFRGRMRKLSTKE